MNNSLYFKKKFYKSLVIVLSLIIIMSAGFLLLNNRANAQNNRKNLDQSLNAQKLFIPPILEPNTFSQNVKEFLLSVQESQHEFSPTIQAKTFSYGDLTYLGPTIRLNNGDDVKIKIKNNLKDSTTFHQHGVHLPAKSDGHVLHPIKKQTSWTSEYTVSQQAGSYWYHPHLIHKTGYQVSQGLAGFLLIDDKESTSLHIPQEYGIDDIPLIVQDKTFDKGKIQYRDNMHTKLMGNIGRSIITNGRVEPTLFAQKSLLRFRILNGSTFAIQKFQFNDKRTMYLIANDAGLLDKPYEMYEIELAPGERREILVDVSDIQHSTADLFLLVNIHGSYTAKALIISSANNFKKSDATIPTSLVSYALMDKSQAQGSRSFILGDNGSGMMSRETLGINGVLLEPKKINEQISLGTTEIWTIKNNSTGRGHMNTLVHSFHPHFGSFQILTINGNPPPPNNRGWKDVLFLMPGDQAEIIMKFNNYTGVYMYHCHQLEHEDAGMAGLFSVMKN